MTFCTDSSEGLTELVTGHPPPFTSVFIPPAFFKYRVLYPLF